MPVNWCPELGTVLANEEVIDGLSERGSHPVVRLPMKQWMLKITAYADRLLEDLDGLDWPESIKEMQRNWIGRSEGATVRFKVRPHHRPCTHIYTRRCHDMETSSAWRIEVQGPTHAQVAASEAGGDIDLEVFTTRPDTIFGVTYMVLAPEHPQLGALTSEGQAGDVKAYVDAAARKSDLERTELQKVKTGVFTGAHAVNPANDERIPIYVADYVLGSYGSGAIMAVPGHDERDFEFAKAYDLPIRQVRGRLVPCRLCMLTPPLDVAEKARAAHANAEIALCCAGGWRRERQGGGSALHIRWCVCQLLVCCHRARGPQHG